MQDVGRPGAPSADYGELVRRAVASMTSGQLEDAERLFTQVVAANPREPAAHQALALIAMRTDRPELAVEHAKRALAIDRRNADYLNTLGIALGSCRRTDEAAEAFRRAVRERPAYADAHCNLGIALRRMGRYDEAVAALRRAAALAPQAAGAHVNLGKGLLDGGDAEAAAASFRAAIALEPDNADAINHLGLALQALGRLDDAIETFRRAVECAPRQADPHNNLGMALRLAGRDADAAASLREALALEPDHALYANNLGLALLALGQLDEARRCLQSAVAALPDFADAHANLGLVLKQQGRLDDAEAALARATVLQPRSADFLANLGSVLDARGRTAEALALFERARAEDPAHEGALAGSGLALLTEGRVRDAIERFERCAQLRPGSASAANNLAVAYRMQGDMPRAVQWCRAALSIDADFLPAQSNLLACLNYLPDVPIAEILAEHRRYGARLEAPFKSRWRAHDNARDPDRRLRIGYVSGDFREHAMAFSIAPVLAGHDPDSYEAVCYANNAREDDFTARLRRSAREWHSVVGMTDDDMAALIRDHGIDVLVDLSGHTALNRLPVFARKPAPVQATWLGYVTSTGLEAIDYRLTDGRADPPGDDESGHTEALVRLPWVTVFEPFAESPPVEALPALGGAPFTYGCLNHPSKVTSGFVTQAARILSAVPGSRILFGNAGDPSVQRRLADAFAAHGVGAARLAFRPKLPLRAFLALHREVDVALDTFPYNGGATTCHALWMGVSVVTLAGDRYMARMGRSLLAQVGLEAFVAHSPDAYVDLAVGAAGDLGHLAALRASLRARVAASPLLDAAAFVTRLEAAYRTMWRAWCADPAFGFAQRARREHRARDGET